MSSGVIFRSVLRSPSTQLRNTGLVPLTFAVIVTVCGAVAAGVPGVAGGRFGMRNRFPDVVLYCPGEAELSA